MRLGQAARTFETTTDKLVKLLAENFREVNDHPNIKLTEEEVLFIEEQFQPKTEIAQDETLVAPREEEAPKLEQQESSEVKEVAPEFIESLRPQVFSLEKDFTEKTQDLEQYKAEKPELDGLKVLGKIDLPEPKPKAEKEDAKKERDTRKERRQPRKERQPRQNQAVEQRKKEQRIAMRKKYEAVKRAKELKKKHYEENIKANLQNPKPKKKRKKELHSVAVSPATKHSTNKTTTAKKATGLKRFWLWLNGAYDKYE